MFRTFVNRERELSFLEDRHKSRGFELIVFYGRRRVGKTELLKQFITDKEHIYFLCDKRGTERNFIRFKTKIADYLKQPVIESNQPEDIFGLLAKSKKRLVVVIDEFSYLVEKDSAIPSVFQIIVDELLKQSNITLILCGSSISMMEKGALCHKSPLYGRKTGHWKLSSVSFGHINKFFPENTFTKNVEFWSILDGIPFYLEFFSDEDSTLLNIEKQILKREGRLYEEVDFMLKEELREPDIYKAILEAIAAGKTKVVEIANSSRINVQDLDKYLKVLMRLGIIRKYSPVTEKPKSKKTVYEFNDNFFHFWFRFCEPFKSDIEISETANVIQKIKRELNSYVGIKFEEICISLLKNLIKIDFTKTGKWWGSYREKGERKTAEIDIVSINKDKILFCECKWQDNVDAEKLLYKLKEKSRLVRWNENNRKEYFALFAKSFNKKIDQKNLFLFDIEDLKKALHSTVQKDV